MVCFSPVGYGVYLKFRALALGRSRLSDMLRKPREMSVLKAFLRSRHLP